MHRGLTPSRERMANYMYTTRLSGRKQNSQGWTLPGITLGPSLSRYHVPTAVALVLATSENPPTLCSGRTHASLLSRPLHCVSAFLECVVDFDHGWKIRCQTFRVEELRSEVGGLLLRRRYLQDAL